LGSNQQSLRGTNLPNWRNNHSAIFPVFIYKIFIFKETSYLLRGIFNEKLFCFSFFEIFWGKFFLNISGMHRKIYRQKRKNKILLMRRKNLDSCLFLKCFWFFCFRKRLFDSSFWSPSHLLGNRIYFLCPRIFCMFIISIHTKNWISPKRTSKGSWIFTMCHERRTICL
jgi:hypothetical protein